MDDGWMDAMIVLCLEQVSAGPQKGRKEGRKRERKKERAVT